MIAPLVPITIAFVVGILLGTFLRGAWWLVAGCGLLSTFLSLRWRQRAERGLVPLLAVWMCLGMVRVRVWEAHPSEPLRSLVTETPLYVKLHGLVSDDPVTHSTPHGAASQTCVIDLLHVQREGTWQPMPGRVRATFQHPVDAVSYGDDVLVEGQWSSVPAPGNPGQYDWRAALARHHIHALLRVKPFNGLVVLPGHRRMVWRSALFWLRHRWERLLDTSFAPQEAGLLRSFLLGQRLTLDEDLTDAFVETGTIHLLVVSGFNVGLVALLLDALARLAGIPWRARLLLVAISLGGYCVLTGFQPPVIRATLMAWIVLGAVARDRVVSWFNTLAAAALVILWIDPTQLFDPGFQLSFGAVLSLLTFTPCWSEGLARSLAWMPLAWLRRSVALSVSATLAIWVGLSPVLAWYFYLVSPVSMLANLLLAPLASALVSVGTSLLLFGSVCTPLMHWGSGLLAGILHAMTYCVIWCHAIPGGYWVVGRPSPWFLAGYYLLIALSVARRSLRITASQLLLCWLTGLTVWCWSAVGVHLAASRWLRVDVLDVGHGDSILVRTPAGHAILVDAGTAEAGTFKVVPFLRRAGMTHLDALILTHPDADHIGGAIPLLQHVRVRQLITNGVHDQTASARMVLQLAAAHRVPETVVASGMRLLGDPGVTIDVLHPPRGLVPGSAPESNDNSVVLKLTKGSVSVLLCGDIEEAGLPWLLGQGAGLRSTVLKVPHHGSRLGDVGERFFQAVSPTVALLSVGRAHHLPAPETIRVLERTGARLYSTRERGAITLRTNGARLDVTTFRQ